MSFVQLAVLDTQSNQTLAERLIDQLANRIGGLGVEPGHAISCGLVIPGCDDTA